MTQQERDRKLEIYDKHKDYAMFDEIISLNDKVSELVNKEEKTYESELEALMGEVSSLKDCLMNKEMVVNVESNVSALNSINDVLKSLLEESKKSESIIVKLEIK